MSEKGFETSPSGAWPTSPSDYVLKNVIGSGAFATVYRAECPSMGQQVAIKIIDLESGGKCTYIHIYIYMYGCMYEYS
jgi:hypothetical protein